MTRKRNHRTENLDIEEHTESTTTCVKDQECTLKSVHVFMLRHRGNGVVRGAHLREDLVQPLQRPVQMYLDPAGGAGHILTVVFGAPALKRGRSHKSQQLS